MENEILQKLNSKLLKGERKEIAQELDLSPAVVSGILTNNRPNHYATESVLNLAIKKIKKRTGEFDEIHKQIQEL